MTFFDKVSNLVENFIFRYVVRVWKRSFDWNVFCFFYFMILFFVAVYFKLLGY